MNIAYASKNIVHIQLMNSIYEVQYAIMKLSYAKLFQFLSMDALIYQQHADIAAAIARRDPIQASKAMEEHIRGILNACRDGGL